VKESIITIQDKYGISLSYKVKSKFVEDLSEGESVEECFAVKSKKSPIAYKNKPGLWFSLIVADRTGEIPVKFWGGAVNGTVTKLFSSFNVGDVLLIKGPIEFDNFSKSLTISVNEGIGQITKVDEYDFSDYRSVSKLNREEMVKEFKEIIDSIKNSDIKRLLKDFFDDEEFMKKYSESPAAQKNHHSYRSGLLEHVLNIIKISRIVVNNYPELDLDILIAGCILHDIGKIVEYKTTTVIDFTVEGRMLGHISIGSKMVEDRIVKLDKQAPFEKSLKYKILNMILSHHGKLEYGSPVLPRFPEAIALHKIDDCDAQVKLALDVKDKIRSDDEIVWTKEFEHMYMK